MPIYRINASVRSSIVVAQDLDQALEAWRKSLGHLDQVQKHPVQSVELLGQDEDLLMTYPAVAPTQSAQPEQQVYRFQKTKAKTTELVIDFSLSTFGEHAPLHIQVSKRMPAENLRVYNPKTRELKFYAPSQEQWTVSGVFLVGESLLSDRTDEMRVVARLESSECPFKLLRQLARIGMQLVPQHPVFTTQAFAQEAARRVHRCNAANSLNVRDTVARITGSYYLLNRPELWYAGLTKMALEL